MHLENQCICLPLPAHSNPISLVLSQMEAGSFGNALARVHYTSPNSAGLFRGTLQEHFNWLPVNSWQGDPCLTAPCLLFHFGFKPCHLGHSYECMKIGQRYILPVDVLVYSQVKTECKLRYKESYADAFFA